MSADGERDPAQQLLRDWLLAIEDGVVSRDELLEIRGRTDPALNEFMPSPLLDDVRRASMRALGIEPGDTDVEPLPDFVPDDLGPPGWSRW